MVTPIAAVKLMKAVIQPGFDTSADRDAGTIPTTHVVRGPGLPNVARGCIWRKGLGFQQWSSSNIIYKALQRELLHMHLNSSGGT